MQELDYKL